MYTIYRAKNKQNNKSYVGFDSNWPKRKLDHHNPCRDLPINRAIKKYGKENFDWEVIYQSKDYGHTLNEMEPYFIKEYDSMKNGYNCTAGGEGIRGWKHSDRTRRLLSKQAKQREITEEQLQTLRDNARRMRYMGHSEETKAKMSESQKKVDKSTYPQSWWDSVRSLRGHLKYYQTEEYRNKMSEACSGPKRHGKAVSAGRVGKKFHHNPETNEQIFCKPEDCPEGFIIGKKK